MKTEYIVEIYKYGVWQEIGRYHTYHDAFVSKEDFERYNKKHKFRIVNEDYEE